MFYVILKKKHLSYNYSAIYIEYSPSHYFINLFYYDILHS